MRLKQFIKLFVPPIYYNVMKRLLPQQESERHPLPKIEHNEEKMIVIGNGPSLNKTMEIYGDVICNTPCVMVNFSACTDLFITIKPSFYLLVDPAWYKPSEKQKENVIACIDDIVTKTIWPMYIVMPISAIGCKTIKKFKENPHISMLFFEDGWKLPNKMSVFEGWDENYICPPDQTVLNTAVWLSIYMGYKETYLVGADTSWHVELQMDQKTNELYTKDTHFYSNKTINNGLYDSTNQRCPIKSTLHKELLSEASALKAYWELRDYADWKGVKVYNASEYSWIDAFERKKLS